ncbi:hypothetical protein Goshw_012333 [Gossypium schwendimanii]|uniref:Uncharacterized protein n=1 Tax=Gossypium schwendimanii TaxID=34291 RepID=A0A7J9MB79_GOSSC|nr:hypothetical protein [Gossypium schwendimanii]
MITEAEKLIADGPQQMNNLCLGGCGSKNYLSSYKFGKKVAEMLPEISDRKSTGVFEKVAENQPATSVVVRPVEQPIALESTIQKVWSCKWAKMLGSLASMAWGARWCLKIPMLERIKIGLVEILGFQMTRGRIKVLIRKLQISMGCCATRDLLYYWIIYGRGWI